MQTEDFEKIQLILQSIKRPFMNLMPSFKTMRLDTNFSGLKNHLMHTKCGKRIKFHRGERKKSGKNIDIKR